MLKSRPLLFLALDVESARSAHLLLTRLNGSITEVKIGLELFTAEGPAVVHGMKACGRRVFLDLKLHDIPETVERAIIRIAKIGVDFTTVHTAGGEEMLFRAVEAAHKANPQMQVLAVTVLTSLNCEALARTGTKVEGVSELVLDRARLAHAAGCHGVIASPQEARMLRQELGPEFLIITPGIRAAGAAKDDQARMGTARQAILDGASGVVVGRNVRDAASPAQAVLELRRELGIS